MIPYALAAALTVYGTTVFQKSLGMFLQGCLHMKVTLAFTHMYELGADHNKPISALILNIVDIMILPITGLVIKFVSKDQVAYYQYVFII